MTGFELQTFGVQIDLSTNWAATNAVVLLYFQAGLMS